MYKLKQVPNIKVFSLSVLTVSIVVMSFSCMQAQSYANKIVAPADSIPGFTLFQPEKAFSGVDFDIDPKVEKVRKSIPATGSDERFGEGQLARVHHNNPGLVVDLGVGLWALPFPVDFAGDGQNDLLVGSGGKPYNGVYHFEGVSDAKGPMVFKPGVRISSAQNNMRISHLKDTWVITKPGTAYPDFKDTQLEEGVEIPYQTDFHTGRTNQWQYFDYDGDGAVDLIIGASDWREYRWDDAYKSNGEWTNGPLQGYVYWVRNLGTTESPEYGKARKVMAGDSPVEVYGMPSPNFADFNGDGLPDLILGEFLDKFTYYENIGTRTQPEYAPGRYLKYKGRIVHMDLQMIQPSAYDWNEDSHVDLIVGDEDGRVAFLENTGSTRSGIPEFKPPVYFQQKAEFVKFGALATPYSIDWDGDEDEDLIVGNTAGYIGLIENLGGYPPKWAAPKRLEAGGEVIRIMAGESGSIQGPAEAKWGYTVPTVADWNHDGLPDIIINSIWGKILWYENTGTRSNPRLAKAKPVTVEWQGRNPKPAWNWWDPKGNELVTQWRCTAQAIDLNEDGLTDLVTLDQEGFLVYFERRKVDGVLELMPPQRIFYMQENAPSVYDSGHDPVRLGGKEGYSLAIYDERGNLAYTGRTRRSSSPRTLSSLYRISGIEQYVQDTSGYGSANPLRLNAGWAGASGRRKFHLTDWTGDGQLDLIVNSGTNANLLENVSTEPGKFIFRDRGQMDDHAIGGHTSNPITVDWNKDGIRDLLIGAEDGFFYYKENSRSSD